MSEHFSVFTRKAILFLSVGLILSACGLARGGPTNREIRAGSVENGGDMHVVDVTDAVAQAARRAPESGFSAAFRSAGVVSSERISAGDLLDVTIWENVDNGVFATAGARVTSLSAVSVDQLGNIFIPYAGVVRASGRTSDQLRIKLTELLATQTPDPQIEVRREPGDGATVSIIGGVALQGVFPITASTRRLTGMLAAAGGVAVEPNIVKITIRRGQETGSVWMQDLFDVPDYDIPLRAGDKIFLEKDERFFLSLGAVGQRRIPFETHNPNVIEALALLGGLISNTSNPRGIFIFRVEPAAIANRVMGRTDFTTPQRIAYVVDLTKPSGIFTAQNFVVEDEDTLYVTEAPYVAWNKVLQTVLGTLNTVTAFETSANNVAGLFE